MPADTDQHATRKIKSPFAFQSILCELLHIPVPATEKLSIVKYL